VVLASVNTPATGLKNPEYGSTQQDLPNGKEEKLKNAGYRIDKEWLSKEPSCFA